MELEQKFAEVCFVFVWKEKRFFLFGKTTNLKSTLFLTSQISKLNLESQRIERQLRDEISSKCCYLS